MPSRDRPDLAEIESFAHHLDAQTELGDAPLMVGPTRVPDDLMATARAVHAASGPRGLTRRFADRLEENLMDLAALDRPHVAVPVRRPAATVRRFPLPEASRPSASAGRRRGLIELLGLTAIVALLFGQVMGLGGNVAFWQDSPPLRTPASPRQVCYASTPAAAAPTPIPVPPASRP